MSSRIKNYLRQNAMAYAVNSHMKSVQLKTRYQKTLLHYTSISSNASLAEHWVRLRRNIEALPGFGCGVRVLFVGTDEQQDSSGFIQALERGVELTLFRHADGSYGQNHRGDWKARVARNSARLRELMAESAARDAVPDIVLMQSWASYMSPAVLSELRARYGCLVFNIAMDDRHQYWGEEADGEWTGTRGLVGHIDLALTAAPECVEWYEKEGCPALFFPEASDPELFKPMPALPKVHDIAFVGGRYGVRADVVSALRRAGVAVTTYGAGWNEGRIETAEVPRLFAQSKIVLGIGTVGHCSDFYALKLRDFDAAMSGSLYLTHDNPDLYSLFTVGEEIVTYRSISDCVEKVRYYLAHDEERESIARAGRARAQTCHTWDTRFAELFRYLSRGGHEDISFEPGRQNTAPASDAG